MSQYATLYPDDYAEWQRDGYFSAPYDYTPILESFGPIVVRVDEEGYTGDSFILYHDARGYGVLIFGWGSCPGCDALQQCDIPGAVDGLISDLRQGIRWFPTPEDCLAFFQTHDWEGAWYGTGEAATQFRNAAEAYLQAVRGGA